MTLYQVCQKINDYLEVKDNCIFDYLVWGSTDNGDFLRTQFSKRKTPLKDKDLGEVRFIVMGMQHDFNPTEFTFTENTSKAQVQVFWCKRGLEVKNVVEINNNLGYVHNIAIVVRQDDFIDC